MLDIKLIKVNGLYKALVLDMAKQSDRLLYIAESDDRNVAYERAAAWVNSYVEPVQDVVAWH